MIRATIQQLKNDFQDSDCVWFLVDVKYRILTYNKKAAQNSIAFHNKQIAPGQSIIDYARDTKNRVDSLFIESFGKAASGQQVETEQHITYDAATIVARCSYTPVLEDDEVKVVSIAVQYTGNQ